MFEKILIANRGEIAARVARTAQKMGIATVAVYSDVDRDSLHVASADEAVHIGAASPAQSYLNSARIIKAALDSGAQAIHPGYGFLSENPEFVEAVEAAGLTFIGPSAASIRAMGLKDAAKALMQKAGVPVVPGYHGADQSDAYLAEQAEQIGYPVLIKAVAGGGGKGMRLVESAEEFTNALQSARAEAQTAFGNDAVLIEKYISCPRHIEVQVFGDGHDVIHLFERDCSLQRRHQKVIEEAPAPGMCEDMRSAMGDAAVRAAQAIHYKGAGTIEFIADASDGLRPDRFWFMEMNTRLQVEHPVTEAVTGIDLVEWQLRVAAGEPLPKAQNDLHLNGHAIEARLYAEDAEKGFLPAAGRLEHIAFAEGCRADSAVRSGDDISPFYDPMIAKLIVHAQSRDKAMDKLTHALQCTQVAGAVTNLGFLTALSQNSAFRSGDVDTDLIARDFEALVAPKPAPQNAIIAAALAVIDLQFQPNPLAGFTLWSPLQSRLGLSHKDNLYEVTATVLGDRCLLDYDGNKVEAHYDGQKWQVTDQHLPPLYQNGPEITVFVNGGLLFDVLDPLNRTSDTLDQAVQINAPMPGLVRDILVQPGQQVAQGTRLLVLEAMKMEHVLVAPRDCHIKDVLVKSGAQVAADDPLIGLADDADGE
ncbi:MAG: acetyl/propionyl/methylcrotonyl-CoA carboxylase subunit alpha [Rhodobacteraceae bacterium]|nr:MAG: acetyl/propionyl/methylcrotonyl-CoA carboxylase subunit alpha [Paracoccaceae bacterium]